MFFFPDLAQSPKILDKNEFYVTNEVGMGSMTLGLPPVFRKTSMILTFLVRIVLELKIFYPYIISATGLL